MLHRKSHFLKYASYCLSALEQAGVSLSELRALQSWYVNKADVEMVIFNIGDVHDANADQATTFSTIFWNQFNAKRGYNSFNLAMAVDICKRSNKNENKRPEGSASKNEL